MGPCEKCGSVCVHVEVCIALYELITARINLKHKWQEEFSVKDFRALLGVPEGKLERAPNLLQRVIQPACLEVNGLADFGVKIDRSVKAEAYADW